MIVQAISDFTPELLKQFCGIDIYAPRANQLLPGQTLQTMDAAIGNLEQPSVCPFIIIWLITFPSLLNEFRRRLASKVRTLEKTRWLRRAGPGMQMSEKSLIRKSAKSPLKKRKNPNATGPAAPKRRNLRKRNQKKRVTLQPIGDPPPTFHFWILKTLCFGNYHRWLIKLFLGHRKRSHSNRSKSASKNSRSRSRDNSVKKHKSEKPEPVESPKPPILAPQAPPEPEPEPIKYLFFKKDDLVKATANAGSGWCYGGIVDNFAEMNKNPRIQGFFPQSYIKTLTSGEQPLSTEENSTDPASQQMSVELQQKQAYQKYQNEKKKYLEKIGSYTEDQQTYSAHEVPGGYAGYAMNSFGNEETVRIYLGSLNIVDHWASEKITG